jgi:hypothetical protein
MATVLADANITCVSGCTPIANCEYFVSGSNGCLTDGTILPRVVRSNTGSGGCLSDGSGVLQLLYYSVGKNGCLADGHGTLQLNYTNTASGGCLDAGSGNVSVKFNGVASVVGASAATCAGVSYRLVSASVVAASTITSVAVVEHNATASLSSVSTIQANTKVTHISAASMASVGGVTAVGRIVRFYFFTGSGGVETDGAAERSFELSINGDGLISVQGTATVTRFYGDWSKCDEDEIKGISLIPNKHKDCFRSRPFLPERKKYIPKSLKGTAAILPAITVSIQNYFLPE